MSHFHRHAQSRVRVLLLLNMNPFHRHEQNRESFTGVKQPLYTLFLLPSSPNLPYYKSYGPPPTLFCAWLWNWLNVALLTFRINDYACAVGSKRQTLTEFLRWRLEIQILQQRYEVRHFFRPKNYAIYLSKKKKSKIGNPGASKLLSFVCFSCFLPVCQLD